MEEGRVSVEEGLWVREARDEDLPVMAELVHAAYRGPLPDTERQQDQLTEGAKSRAWTTEAHIIEGRRTTTTDLKEMMANPNIYLFVAELDESKHHSATALPQQSQPGTPTLVGCFYLHQKKVDEQDTSAPLILLGMLSVDPSRQGLGLGKKLVQAASELAKSKLHGKRLRITVIHVRTDLLAWYKKLGFVDTEIREVFHPNKHEKCLVPDLHFAHLDKEL